MMLLHKWPQKLWDLSRFRQSALTTPSLPEPQQLLDSLNDVVLALDKEQRLLSINQSWQSLSGVNVSESLNTPLCDYIHPEDLASWNQQLASLIPGQRQQIWLRLLHSSGEIRWCEMRLQSLHANQRYPVSATLYDITPQVRDQQIRSAGHRSLQSLVNRLPAMLYRSRNNISWTMEYVSQGCELLTGYPAASLLNRSQVSFGSLIHPDDDDYVWDTVQAALHHHQCFDLSYRIYRKNGEQIQVRDKGHGLYSDSGMVLGVEGIILPDT